MPRIDHLIRIKAEKVVVFEALTSPDGLNSWWTLQSSGLPVINGIYNFHFDPAYDWFAKVTDLTPGEIVEWTFTKADEDWTGTILRIELNSREQETVLSLSHLGWANRNDHFRRSSYCWAMYMNCLKKYVEDGTVLPYSKRGS